LQCDSKLSHRQDFLNQNLRKKCGLSWVCFESLENELVGSKPNPNQSPSLQSIFLSSRVLHELKRVKIYNRIIQKNKVFLISN